jgi:hypothetical protein
MPAKSNVARKSPPKGDPTVGRYIVGHADGVPYPDSFWTTSWDFINALQAAGNQIGVQFTDSQYFWEVDFEYLSDKNNFVNGVNIAYTAAHGNYWYYLMTVNGYNPDGSAWGPGVSIGDIGNTGGYGASAGGSLAYWIIHACEVIPTQADESNSFDAWWGVFNGGLHAVVGFRTEAFIDDGVFAPFGSDIGSGVSVVGAWLQDVMARPDYQANYMYCDGNRLICEPLGRPSVVVPEGHGDDVAWDIDPLGPPGVLWEFWWDNNCNCPPCTPGITIC